MVLEAEACFLLLSVAILAFPLLLWPFPAEAPSSGELDRGGAVRERLESMEAFRPEEGGSEGGCGNFKSRVRRIEREISEYE